MHVKDSFERQALQRQLQVEAALDGLDNLLLHSGIQAYVDDFPASFERLFSFKPDFDLQHLMDPSGSCVSYIYACDANREVDEATCFLTNRGYGRPIINFKVSDLDNQWKRAILYKGNNALNVNAVEKAFQKRYDYLPQGTRRLWKRPGAGGVGNKRDKSIPYPYIVGIFYREQGLQPGMILN